MLHIHLYQLISPNIIAILFCIAKDAALTINLEQYIVHTQVSCYNFQKKKNIFFVQRSFLLKQTMNGDSDEMLNNAAFHLGLYCL